jgi:type VI secretion system secreted protein Hcp
MAVDIFLKLDGIKGEAQDAVHKSEIDVLSWSWGAYNAGNAHVGTGAGSGKVDVQDLSITKYVDLASPALVNALSLGKHIPSATLVIRKAGDKPLEYVTVTLTDVMVTNWTTGGSGGEDRLTENVTLNFAKFKIQYKEQTDTGGAGASPEFSFDIRANTQT